MNNISFDFLKGVDGEPCKSRNVWYKKAYEKDGCVVCDNVLNQDGYMRVGSVKAGRCRMAHVMVYENVHGVIPDGKEINHVCKNRACFNIEHLELLEGSEHTTITNIERVGYEMVRYSDEDIKDFYYRVKTKQHSINYIVKVEGIKRSTLSSIMNKRSRCSITDEVDEIIKKEIH